MFSGRRLDIFEICLIRWCASKCLFWSCKQEPKNTLNCYPQSGVFQYLRVSIGFIDFDFTLIKTQTSKLKMTFKPEPYNFRKYSGHNLIHKYPYFLKQLPLNDYCNIAIVIKNAWMWTGCGIFSLNVSWLHLFVCKSKEN